MLRGYDAARVAILTLGCCENAVSKARRPQEHFANSRDFDNVYTNGNDHK